MSTPLIKEQIRDVYRAIISQDKEFVELFAQVAIEDAAEVRDGMWIDDTDQPLPTPALVKQQAIDFGTDMMQDFITAYRCEVTNAHVGFQQSLQTNVIFASAF